MLSIGLEGKRALVAGIADDKGFGFAIARSLAAAGASVCAATWPPAYRSFKGLLGTGRLDASMRLPSGDKFEFEKIYPLDARYCVPSDVPQEVRDNRRYREFERFTIQDLADDLEKDFGPRPLDIVVHCIANGTEVMKPLLETSRAGYLDAISASAYSFVALAQRMGGLMRPSGSMVCLSYIAAQRVVPGYGGGMSSAKAALESDMQVLAFELGRRHGVRVNCLSPGPWPSRAAGTIGFIDMMARHVANNAPIPRTITPDDVAHCATFLSSPLAGALTGCTLYVDHGSHCMSVAFTTAQMTASDNSQV
jgi:enoyl-[acyl-carrier protein] reductase I